MRTQLLNDGYKEFPLSRLKTCEFNDSHLLANYQRCFRSPDGEKLFYVTVFEYRPLVDSPGVANVFNSESQFTSKDGHTFDVILHSWETVTELNVFFQEIFQLLNCIPYDN
jgi:hypothetical protein